MYDVCSQVRLVIAAKDSMFTCKTSRYCLLVLHGRADESHQLAALSGICTT